MAATGVDCPYCGTTVNTTKALWYHILHTDGCRYKHLERNAGTKKLRRNGRICLIGTVLGYVIAQYTPAVFVGFVLASLSFLVGTVLYLWALVRYLRTPKAV